MWIYLDMWTSITTSFGIWVVGKLLANWSSPLNKEHPNPRMTWPWWNLHVRWLKHGGSPMIFAGETAFFTGWTSFFTGWTSIVAGKSQVRCWAFFSCWEAWAVKGGPDDGCACVCKYIYICKYVYIYINRKIYLFIYLCVCVNLYIYNVYIYILYAILFIGSIDL